MTSNISYAPRFMMIVMLITLLFSGLIWAVMYALDATGKYKLAKARGMKDSWAAWIPAFGSIYMLGALVSPFKLGNAEIKGFKWWLSVCYVVLGTAASILSMYVSLSVTMGMLGAYSNTFASIASNTNFMAAMIAMMGLSLIMMVVGIFYYIALYRLFKLYRPDSAVLFLVLSILLGLSFVFVFIIRNDPFPETEASSDG